MIPIRKIILSIWVIITWIFTGYMFYEYIFQPNKNWNILPNICCTLHQKIPIYLHIFGACLILIFGPIQLLRIKGHIDTGIIYINGCIFASLFGLTFIALNDTVGGLLMTIPFIVYGILVLIFVMILIYNINRCHYKWAVRSYILGSSSVFYRVLYFVICPIIKYEIVTFDKPIDYVINWLFFVIPMIITELCLYYQ